MSIHIRVVIRKNKKRVRIHIEWKRTLDDIAMKLFPFSFSLAVRHAAFTTLADRAVHVLGQFQHFNQICKLLHGKCIIVNTKVSEEQTGFLFFGAALVVHGIDNKTTEVFTTNFTTNR